MDLNIIDVMDITINSIKAFKLLILRSYNTINYFSSKISLLLKRFHKTVEKIWEIFDRDLFHLFEINKILDGDILPQSRLPYMYLE